jgi:hypothetical protein
MEGLNDEMNMLQVLKPQQNIIKEDKHEPAKEGRRTSFKSASRMGPGHWKDQRHGDELEVAMADMKRRLFLMSSRCIHT